MVFEMCDKPPTIQSRDQYLLVVGYFGIFIRIFLVLIIRIHEQDDLNLHNYRWVFYLYGAITISANILMIYGIHKRQHYFIIPYLTVIILEIPLSAIALIFDVTFIFYGGAGYAIELCIGGLMIVWNFYTGWLFMKNFRKLDVENAYRMQVELENLHWNQINCNKL